MANQEDMGDIERAKAGKEVWNAWAEKESKKSREKRAKVDFMGANFSDEDFSGFIFPGQAKFTNATFKGKANFEGAEFNDETFFSTATFRDEVNFEGATFKDVTSFESATFKGSTKFKNATFEKTAKFRKAIFNDWANFEDTKFNDKTSFEKATFEGRTKFENAMFKDTANFRRTIFKDWANFKGATFKDMASFNNATFKDRTFFTDTYFEKAPSFHNAAIHQDTAFSSGKAFFKQFPDIESKDAEGKGDAERAYRTLKLAMSKYQSHTEEAGFFKLELKARALKEKERHWKWLYKAYELFSDYGQSVSTPFFWWLGLGVAVFVIYTSILGNPGEAFTVTMAQAIPLIGVEKKAYYDALKALFPQDGNAPLCFQITRAIHMLASSALIFLMLLALRNRFKIK